MHVLQNVHSLFTCSYASFVAQGFFDYELDQKPTFFGTIYSIRKIITIGSQITSVFPEKSMSINMVTQGLSLSTAFSALFLRIYPPKSSEEGFITTCCQFLHKSLNIGHIGLALIDLYQRKNTLGAQISLATAGIRLAIHVYCKASLPMSDWLKKADRIAKYVAKIQMFYTSMYVSNIVGFVLRRYSNNLVHDKKC